VYNIEIEGKNLKQSKLATLLLGLFLFSSCNGASSSIAVQQKAASVAWINSTPSDNSSYYYGVGEGKTLTDAKNNALADISSRISVSVNATFSSSLSASRIGNDEEIASKVKQDVVTKAKEIEYSNVEIQESSNDGTTWHVLVQVDRNLLAQSYIDKLTKVDNQLQNEWDIFSSASMFEKLKLSNGINALLSQTDTIFPILKTIKPSFDDAKYSNRYTMYTKEIRDAQNKLVFSIKADQNSETLASLLHAQLSNANYKFSDTAYNVLIKIKTSATQQKIDSANPQFANMIWALRTTTIEAYNKAGTRVSNAVIKTKSGSPEGFNDAVARTKKYEEIITRDGIISFITNGNQKK
jgi:hypothetical protein